LKGGERESSERGCVKRGVSQRGEKKRSRDHISATGIKRITRLQDYFTGRPLDQPVLVHCARITTVFFDGRRNGGGGGEKNATANADFKMSLPIRPEIY